MTSIPAEPVVTRRDRAPAGLDEVVARIEESAALDAVARQVHAVVRAALPAKALGVLRGHWLGHPLHPALVGVPIGSWLSVSILDLTGSNGAAARRLVGFGVLAAIPTAAAGAADWVRIDPDEEPAALRVGILHGLMNDLALGLYTASWIARRRHHRVRGALLALAGSGVLGAAAWLGGHLVFRCGTGVEAH